MRCNQKVPLRRAPTAKIIRSFSGLSVLLTPGDRAYRSTWRAGAGPGLHSWLAMATSSVKPGPQEDSPIVGRIDRFDLKGRSLRAHAAQGTLVNAAFQVGLSVIGASRRFF